MLFKLCLIVETERIMPSDVAPNVEERKEELSLRRRTGRWWEAGLLCVTQAAKMLTPVTRMMERVE